MAQQYVNTVDKSIIKKRNVASNYFSGQNGQVGARQPNNPISERLRTLQAVLEGTTHGASTRMAHRLGIKVSRWLNILGGLPLSLEVQDRLIERVPGLSVDWIRYGRREGLSYKLAESLGLIGEGRATGENHSQDRA